MEEAYASMRETINEDLPSTRETIKDLNERNRRMEDALIHISNALGAQSAEDSGPNTRST